MRPDHLGCYGCKRNTSPNIDKFAQNGVIFTNAFSTSTWTFSAIPSIMTGLYPKNHRLYGFKYDFNLSLTNIIEKYVLELDILNPKAKTMGEILKKYNYDTALFTGLEIFKLMKSVNKFFDEYVINPNNATVLTDMLIDWINQRKGRPFFLWIHYLDPHIPYDPPYPYDRLFLDDKFFLYNHKRIPISVSEDFYYSYKSIPKRVAKDGIEDVDYYISQYDGEIRYVDQEIGRLWQSISSNGLTKKTLVIITADHGTFLGEHDIWFSHGWKPYEPVIKVPLIIYYPHKFIKHRKISQPVSLVDIMPTIFEIAKLKMPKHRDGKSLLPVIQGKKNIENRRIFVEYKDKLNNKFFCALRTESWKMVYVNKEGKANYELYNLKNDPQESMDIANMEKEEFETLKKELDEFMQSSSRQISRKEEVDENTINRLRSLGYLQ